MSRRYSPDQKAEALALLQANGSISQTSMMTEIPERTLYTWRREQWRERKLQQLQQQPPPPPPPQMSDFETDADAFAYMREHIIGELLNIVTTLKEDRFFSTPYQRVLALSQLLDRLIKLDAYRPPTREENMIVIRYQDPDGTLHGSPYWYRRSSGAAPGSGLQPKTKNPEAFVPIWQRGFDIWDADKAEWLAEQAAKAQSAQAEAESPSQEEDDFEPRWL